MSHAYSAWSARARALVSTFARTQPSEEIHHLERGERRIPPFVSVRATRALLGLLHRVGREQPEADRHIEVRARLGQSARGLASNEVEMRRLAADHGAQGDDGVVALGCEKHAGRAGKLPGARHPYHVDALARATVAGQGIDRSLHQSS